MSQIIDETGVQCRIVVTDLQGNFVDHIGGNGAQLKDGSFEDAGFNRPQGLIFSSKHNSLFVADTENHALRQVYSFGQACLLLKIGSGFPIATRYISPVPLS